MTKALTDAEKAFFETGGNSDMPEDYLNDVRTVSQDVPQAEASGEAHQEPEPQPEDQAQPPDDGAHEPVADESADNQAQQSGEAKRTVPLATYMEEKKNRQATERRLEEIHNRFSQATERWTQAFDALAKSQNPPQQPQQAPEPEKFEPPTDPVEQIQWTTQQIMEMRRQERENNAIRQQNERENEGWRQLANNYSRALQSATEQTPEIAEVRDYLYRQRVGETMVVQGVSQEEALRVVQQEELHLAALAAQRNIHPVAQLIMVARSRGYVPHSERNQAPAEQSQQQPQAQAAQVAQHLERIAQGQQSNSSLSAAGTSGNARSGRVDAKALADMTDKEFKAFLAKDDDGEMWRKAMA